MSKGSDMGGLGTRKDLEDALALAGVEDVAALVDELEGVHDRGGTLAGMFQLVRRLEDEAGDALPTIVEHVEALPELAKLRALIRRVTDTAHADDLEQVAELLDNLRKHCESLSSAVEAIARLDQVVGVDDEALDRVECAVDDVELTHAEFGNRALVDVLATTFHRSRLLATPNDTAGALRLIADLPDLLVSR